MFYVYIYKKKKEKRQETNFWRFEAFYINEWIKLVFKIFTRNDVKTT